MAKPSFVKPLLESYASNAEKGIPNNFTMAEINGAAASVLIAESNPVILPRRAVLAS